MTIEEQQLIDLSSEDEYQIYSNITFTSNIVVMDNLYAPKAGFHYITYQKCTSYGATS